MSVVRIEYRESFLYEPGAEKQNYAPHEGSWTSDIPQEILSSLLKENVLSLAGKYGDPRSAEPAQVEELLIETDAGRVEITVNNRAILLFTGNNENMKRLHRFLCVVQKCCRKTESAR